MKRNQTLHETLIPLLVEGLGAKTYLELGTHENETIGKVRCERRFGVDIYAKPDTNMTFPDGGMAIFRMTTQDFIRDIAEKFAPYDFVFIDADHSADAVRADFGGIWPFVSSEGIVCLHDTNPGTVADTAPGLCGDSWKTARRLSVDFEAVTLPYHPGLTIIRKREKWGPE